MKHWLGAFVDYVFGEGIWNALWVGKMKKRRKEKKKEKVVYKLILGPKPDGKK